MNFEACLSLPRDRREAALIADNLEELARALRDWPDEAWLELGERTSPDDASLFERMAARTAEAALDVPQRAHAKASALAAADVLRVLWPEVSAPGRAVATRETPPELATT